MIFAAFIWSDFTFPDIPVPKCRDGVLQCSTAHAAGSVLRENPVLHTGHQK